MIPMTAAELRAIREGLGVTAEWLADHLGVRQRSVKRWESGESPISVEIAGMVTDLEAAAAMQVDTHLADLAGIDDPIMVIEDDGDPEYPTGWQRMVAFRVRQAKPGLRIVDMPGVGSAQAG